MKVVRQGANWVATERLYLTADKSKVLSEGEPGAAYLLVAAGGILPEDAVKRHGLSGSVAVDEPEPVIKAARKNRKVAPELTR